MIDLLTTEDAPRTIKEYRVGEIKVLPRLPATPIPPGVAAQLMSVIEAQQVLVDYWRTRCATAEAKRH